MCGLKRRTQVNKGCHTEKQKMYMKKPCLRGKGWGESILIQYSNQNESTGKIVDEKSVSYTWQ